MRVGTRGRAGSGLRNGRYSVSLMLCEINARMTVDLRAVVGNETGTKRCMSDSVRSCWWIYSANDPVYLRTGTKGGAFAK